MGDMIVTLPTQGEFGPFSITAQESQRILILDHRGRRLGFVGEMGETATFEKRRPWWRLWRPKWVQVPNKRTNERKCNVRKP